MPAPRRKTLLFRFAYRLVRLFLRVYFRFRVQGAHHVPGGAAVVVANHPSALDPVILAAALPRRAIFIAAAEFLRLPFVGWAMRAYGIIPVRRGQADPSVLKDAAHVLAAGGLVVIFPEGRVSPHGGPAKPGAAMLVAAAKVPIVPAAITGTARAFPLGAVLPRPVRVTVVFGPPVSPAAGDRSAAAEGVETALSWIRTAVQRP